MRPKPLAMNVVVFAVNDCPVAALGPYGNEWIGTTNLDRFAAEGIVFDQHYSDCPDPIAARWAWRTGRYQYPLIQAKTAQPSTASPDLLDHLKQKGIQTILVRHTRSSWTSYLGFYDGWSERFDAAPEPSDPAPVDSLLRILPKVLENRPSSERWLLWIEIDRLVPPWSIPQGVFEAYVEDLFEVDPESDDLVVGDNKDERQEPRPDVESVEPWIHPPTGWFDVKDMTAWELLHRSFAAAITAFDAEFGRVFELLQSLADDETAWVLTADRGQSLGEHGLIGPHRPWLHEELVHLPLIVRLPRMQEAGRRIRGLTQPNDLMPTIAAWLGLDLVTLDLDGIDLAPLIRGQVTDLREFVCSGLAIGPAAEWALRTPSWTYLLPANTHPDDDPREPLLYARPDDRWEVNDLRLHNLELVDKLDGQLRAVITPH